VEVRIELVEGFPVDLRFVHGQECCPHARKVLPPGVATREDHAGLLERHPRLDDVLEPKRPEGHVQAQESNQGVAGQAIDRGP
jgi:hypothetical protein